MMDAYVASNRENFVVVSNSELKENHVVPNYTSVMIIGELENYRWLVAYPHNGEMYVGCVSGDELYEKEDEPNQENYVY